MKADTRLAVRHNDPRILDPRGIGAPRNGAPTLALQPRRPRRRLEGLVGGRFAPNVALTVKRFGGNQLSPIPMGVRK